MNQDSFFSRNAHLIKGSPIDAIIGNLPYTSPDAISFSVGSPSASNIPVTDVMETSTELFTTTPATFLNYEDPEGNPELRRLIADTYASLYGSITPEHLLITTGCTQGFDLTCRLFLDFGDVVIVEDPTYCISFSTAHTYGARVAPVPIDESGLIPSLVEEEIIRRQESGERVKMVYVIPNAQNPSGVTLSLERRKALVQMAQTHGVLLIEDDPYGELMFNGMRLPSLYSLDETGRHVIHLNSFSKIVAPGFRTGWLVAHPHTVEKMAKLKHTLDSCTNSFAQHLLLSFAKKGGLSAHIKGLQKDYLRKKNQMSDALHDQFKDTNWTWTCPDGGLFIWVTADVDTDVLLQEASARGVMFIPGSAFHPSGRATHTFRLCYSSVDTEEMAVGMNRLRMAYDAIIGTTSPATL